MKKLIVVITVAVVMAGCANLKFQWAASYQTENLAADIEQARRAGE